MTLCFAAFAAAAEAKYVPPDRRIVLNEVVEFSPEVPLSFPVYLSRGGRYYLELYLESDDEQASLPHDQTVTLSMTVEFLRRDRLFRSEDISVAIAPGSRVQTLLWTKAPWELPQRKEIDVNITVHAANDEFMDNYSQFRLQLTRKFEAGPIFIR